MPHKLRLLLRMTEQPVQLDELLADLRAQPRHSVAPADPSRLYRWFWRAKLPERHGQTFRVLARGTMNSCRIEFPDGWRCVTSRNALRRA